MIIITSYRLEEQGGFLFRKDKRGGEMPDMRREVDDGTRRTTANSERGGRKGDKTDDTTDEMRQMREAPPRTAGLYSTVQTIQRGNDRSHNRGKRRWNSMRNRNNTTNTEMVEDSDRVLSKHIKNAGGKI